jgi:phage tail sheath gpL-like
MPQLSDAVGLERISRVVGYKLTKGDYAETSPNLPQRVALIAEVNNANQSVSTTGVRILSAKQVGQLCGYGSPAHIKARILFPNNGGGAIGGIPVYLYPILAAGGATSKKYTLTVSGTATSGGTATVVIGGRYSLDGGSYAFNYANGDTATQVAVKINTAINNVLGCPFTAAETSPVGAVNTLESKWKGLTAEDLTVSVDYGANANGLTYTIVSTQTATGTPSVQGALDQFGNEWVTIVDSAFTIYQSTIITELQNFNGIPDPINPTGRYQGIIFKPFRAITGNVTDSTAVSADTAITDALKAQVTIAVAPAPLSKALPMEAASNMTTLYARICQDNPQLDVEGLSYPDMPVATTTPAMASYDVRDAIVKMGMSTVNIVAGAYQVQDFVTTYHPVGEIPPQYMYCRNVNLDDNIRYAYYLLEQINVVSHMIAADTDIVNASNVIKPKQWKAIVQELARTLTLRGLVADTAFMANSVQVSIGLTNPDRLETFFRYKRTGTVRIASTTAEAGFNFGTA